MVEDENHCDESDASSNNIWNIDIYDDATIQEYSPSLNSSGDVLPTCSTTGTTNGNKPKNTQEQHATTAKYTCKKPIWWRRQAGRKISSRQRQAILAIQQSGLQLTLQSARTNNLSPGKLYDELNGKMLQLDWRQVFPSFQSPTVESLYSGDEICFEIGFGLGDNLLCLASTIGPENMVHEDHPHRKFFVGAEMHKGGIGTICTRIQSANHEKKYWTGYTLFHNSSVESMSQASCINVVDTPPQPLYSNVRLYMGDGIKLLPVIPDNSITAVLITFPDPFMGTNQSSFRILQLEVLNQIRRILISPHTITNVVNDTEACEDTMLRCGGRLYLATDHVGYHSWSHEQVSIFNSQTKQRQTRLVDPNSELAPMVNGNINTQAFTHVVESRTFQLIEPTPDRSQWLPIVSKYEQKGIDEGRETYLSCWEAR